MFQLCAPTVEARREDVTSEHATKDRVVTVAFGINGTLIADKLGRR